LHNIPSSEWSLTSSFLDHSSSHQEKMFHSNNNNPYQKNHSTMTRTPKQKRARLPPAYHCRLALLVLDLQNDFLGDESPSFYLSKQMNGNHYLSRHRSTLMQRIRELALQTQQQGGVVFFIQSLYSPTSSYCAMSSPGSAFHPLAKALRHELLLSSSSSKPSSSPSSSAAAATAASTTTTTNVAAAAAANHNHNNVHVMVKPWHSAFLETTLHAQLQRFGVEDLITTIAPRCALWLHSHNDNIANTITNITITIPVSGNK